jgi:hypothetical protein
MALGFDFAGFDVLYLWYFVCEIYDAKLELTPTA